MFDVEQPLHGRLRIVDQRLCGVWQNLLAHVRHGRVTAESHRSFVRLDFAAYDAHDRTFPRPVRPDQADAFALFDAKGDVGEHRAGDIGFGDVLELQHVAKLLDFRKGPRTGAETARKNCEINPRS